MLVYIDEFESIYQNMTDSNVSCRKKINMRDNLFVMNAVINSRTRGFDEACDVCVYNVQCTKLD